MTLSDKELKYIYLFLSEGGFKDSALRKAGITSYQDSMLIDKLKKELTRREKAEKEYQDYLADLDELKAEQAISAKNERAAKLFVRGKGKKK